MRKIVEGKVYNTMTAEMLAEYFSGHSIGDYHRYEEELYKTKKGAYFIHGKGGAASKYAERCPSGGYNPGEDIRPISEDTAKKWAQDRLSVDEYEEIFGPLEEA